MILLVECYCVVLFLYVCVCLCVYVCMYVCMCVGWSPVKMYSTGVLIKKRICIINALI